jgi:hypothetical protein
MAQNSRKNAIKSPVSAPHHVARTPIVSGDGGAEIDEFIGTKCDLAGASARGSPAEFAAAIPKNVFLRRARDRGSHRACAQVRANGVASPSVTFSKR